MSYDANSAKEVYKAIELKKAEAPEAVKELIDKIDQVEPKEEFDVSYDEILALINIYYGDTAGMAIQFFKLGYLRGMQSVSDEVTAQ